MMSFVQLLRQPDVSADGAPGPLPDPHGGRAGGRPQASLQLLRHLLQPRQPGELWLEESRRAQLWLVQSLDPDIQRLAASFIVHYEFDTAIKNCSENKVIMCESTLFLQNIIRSSFTTNGQSSLYISNERLFRFGVSFVMQKDSPYTAK